MTSRSSTECALSTGQSAVAPSIPGRLPSQISFRVSLGWTNKCDSQFSPLCLHRKLRQVPSIRSNITDYSEFYMDGERRLSV